MGDNERIFAGRRILLIIGGGIAAYKSLDLIRRLRERGAAVRAVMTASAKHFVTPLSVGSLTGERVYDDVFALTDEATMGHIELSRDADLVLVAPATANLMARMAGGLADDLASTLLLATDTRVLIAPAMNLRMWLHPATRRNLDTLRQDGVRVVGPDDGAMACGEYGPGRMAEPLAIVAAAAAALAAGTAIPLPPGVAALRGALPGAPAQGAAPITMMLPTAAALDAAAPNNGAAAPLRRAEPGRPLAGVKVVVTSGPTREPIDPVRYIANRSSGRQGHAIAAAAAAAGAEVVLVSGPVDLPDPAGLVTIHVETARDMQAAVEAALPADVVVAAAAVADWRPAGVAADKLKKSDGLAPRIEIVENPDILAGIGRRAQGRPRLVVGFAAETRDVIRHAAAKLDAKGCDVIVANDVGPGTGTMGGAFNQVHIVTKAGVDSWPRMSKDDVARRLAGLFAARLSAVAAGSAAGAAEAGATAPEGDGA